MKWSIRGSGRKVFVMVTEIITCDRPDCAESSKEPMDIMIFIKENRYDFCSLTCLEKEIGGVLNDWGFSVVVTKDSHL